MKVKTIVRFHDAKEDVVREVGDVFEVSETRHAQIAKLVEEVGNGPAKGKQESAPKDEKAVKEEKVDKSNKKDEKPTAKKSESKK